MVRLHYGLVALGLLAAAPLVAQGGGPKPRAPRTIALFTADVSPPLAADTLVLVTGWTLPVNDGKGALDSLRVQVVGWTPTPSMVWRTAGWTFPTTHTFRVPVDYGVNTGGTGTFDLRACVGVWRYRQYAETCSAIVPFVLTYPAPPAPVTVNLNVSRVP